MVDVKISDLTAAGSATGAMQFEVNDGGNSKRVTGNQLQDLIIGSAATGLVARTAPNTVAQRIITNGNGIAVSNGDGVSGDPTVSVDFATQAEAEAGTSTVKGMSPLRVFQAIAKVFGVFSKQTGNFNAVAGGRYRCETGAGAIVSTMPTTPVDGDKFTFRRKGANTVTMGRNGKTIAGLASDLVIDTDKREVELTYNATTGDYEVVARAYA